MGSASVGASHISATTGMKPKRIEDRMSGSAGLSHRMSRTPRGTGGVNLAPFALVSTHHLSPPLRGIGIYTSLPDRISPPLGEVGRGSGRVGTC